MERLEAKFGELQTAMEDLTREVGHLRREFHRRTFAVVVLGVALLALVISVTWVQLSNDRRIEESERRWCSMLTLLTSEPGARPMGEYGRSIARESAALAKSFGCPPNAG